MTSNLSVIRRLDKFTLSELLNTPITYPSTTLRMLLVQLVDHAANRELNFATYEGYVEAIVMHPDFLNDSELDSRMSMFKNEPSHIRFLALQGTMLVYEWLNS